MKVHSFTNEFPGRSNVLMSDIEVMPHKKTESFKAIGIWDTGATHSVITKRYAKKLNLIPIGIATVKGVNGTKNVNRYIIDLRVHPNVLIGSVIVTETDDLSADTNVAMLIGMDIIGIGDFAVSNHNGKTSFSFRIPSLEKIDFNTQRPHFDKPKPLKVTKKIGRNDPCPCGSGKKYKHCCGRKN